jgi:hypothetical protein
MLSQPIAKLSKQDAFRRAKKADRDEARKLAATPKKKLTKRQAARLEVKRARRAAKMTMKRYHVDHLRWIMLRQEKRKMCADLRRQFKELSQEFFALSALMKESALRLKNSLTSWGDARTTQSEKALAYAAGFNEGKRAAEEAQRQATVNAATREVRRMPDAKPVERPIWEFKGMGEQHGK